MYYWGRAAVPVETVTVGVTVAAFSWEGRVVYGKDGGWCEVGEGGGGGVLLKSVVRRERGRGGDMVRMVLEGDEMEEVKGGREEEVSSQGMDPMARREREQHEICERTARDKRVNSAR